LIKEIPILLGLHDFH